MSIGLDFILRAKTDGFTSGMASVNNSIKDVKKSLREFDVGNGLKQALGVGGIIAAFRMAIDSAQKTRDELERLGKPVDDATRSVAAYGDGLDKTWEGAKKLSVTVLSFATRAGEGYGMLINRLRGVTAEQEKLNEATGRAADLQQKQRDAAYEAASARSKTIDAELKAQRESNETAGMTNEEKRNKLLEKRTKLFEEIDRMVERPEEGPDAEKNKVYNVARKKKQLEAAKLTGQIADLGRGLVTDYKDEQKQRDQKAREELRLAQESDEKLKNDVREKFAPSVEQLANMEVGGFARADDPRLKARQILQKEKFAAEAGSRGDIAGALKLGTEATAMREGLGNVTGKGTALTAETATQALKLALEQTNKELVEVRTAMQGIIKAQK